MRRIMTEKKGEDILLVVPCNDDLVWTTSILVGPERKSGGYFCQ